MTISFPTFGNLFCISVVAHMSSWGCFLLKSWIGYSVLLWLSFLFLPVLHWWLNRLWSQSSLGKQWFSVKLEKQKVQHRQQQAWWEHRDLSLYFACPLCSREHNTWLAKCGESASAETMEILKQDLCQAFLRQFSGKHLVIHIALLSLSCSCFGY